MMTLEKKNYSHVWEGIKHISYIDKGGGAGYILSKIHTLTHTYTHTHTHTLTLSKRRVFNTMKYMSIIFSITPSCSAMIFLS